MDEGALIVVIGGDTRLRNLSWDLLAEGLVSHANRVDLGENFLQGADKKRKFSSSGVGVLLTTTRAKLDQTMARIKTLGAGDELRAFALPMLASLAT